MCEETRKPNHREEDEEKRSEERTADRPSDPDVAGRCGPIIEGMLRECCESLDCCREAKEGLSDSGMADSCKAIMAKMMQTCCKPSAGGREDASHRLPRS